MLADYFLPTLWHNNIFFFFFFWNAGAFLQNLVKAVGSFILLFIQYLQLLEEEVDVNTTTADNR